jgi:hypothetical protein
LLNTNTSITASNPVSPTINLSTFVTYTASFVVPTTAKTLRIGIGTNTGANTNVLYVAEVQLELGSVATTFKKSGGSIGGELALCQRYYIRTLSTQLSSNYGLGLGNSTTQTYFQVQIPEMRTTPTVLDYSLLEASDGSAAVAFSSLAINAGNSTARVAFLIGGHTSGITQYRPYLLRNNASISGYLGLGAEL